MTFCYFYYHVIAECSGCCRIIILIVLLLLAVAFLAMCTLCSPLYAMQIFLRIQNKQSPENFYPEIKQTLTLLLLCPRHHFKVICLFTLPDLLLNSFGLDCASPFWIHKCMPGLRTRPKRSSVSRVGMGLSPN